MMDRGAEIWILFWTFLWNLFIGEIKIVGYKPTKPIPTVILLYFIVIYLFFSYYFPSFTDVVLPSTPEVVRNYGYPLEEHKVQTEDGFILTMHRIPPANDKLKRENPVIFLQHGIMCGSASYALLGPNRSLAYLLADRGYDVWMGNSRGTTSSMVHILYSSSDPEYWDFSWHEMGVYDLPAEIDYILNKTGQKNITFVVHSMGATMTLVLLTTKPEYNEKISYIIAMAPAIQSNEIKWTFAEYYGLYVSPFLLKFKNQNCCPNIEKVLPMIHKICEQERKTHIFCEIAYNFFGTSTQINKSALADIFSSLTSASVRAFAHFGQNYIARKFQKFDYGAEVNEVLYGSSQPPEYNLSLVSTPVTVMYGKTDTIIDVHGMYRLIKSLPNSVSPYEVPLENFNHVDFLFATNAVEVVYNTIFRLLDENKKKIGMNNENPTLV